MADRPDEKIVIIGGGEVVGTRLLPSLLAAGSGKSQIVVVAPFVSRQVESLSGRPEVSILRLDALKILSFLEENPAFVLIATPPFAHYEYMQACSRLGLQHAVEKPISCFVSEIDQLKSTPPDPLVFGIGYYSLEKALPLSYLLSRHSEWASVLDICSDGSLDKVCSALGKPRTIKCDLMEGVDRSPSKGIREWTEMEEFGGMLLETVIHPFSLISRICGGLNGMALDCVQTARSVKATGSTATLVKITGQVAQCRIDVKVGKYIPPELCRRRMNVEYDDGVVVCDFDARAVRVESKIGVTDIKVNSVYKQNYSAICSLLNKFRLGGYQSMRFDDWHHQLTAADALLQIQLPPPQKAYDDTVPF